MLGGSWDGWWGERGGERPGRRVSLIVTF